MLQLKSNPKVADGGKSALPNNGMIQQERGKRGKVIYHFPFTFLQGVQLVSKTAYL
jgi:hypothetical protein